MRAAFRRQLEQVGLWFVFLDPSFNAMRAVSQRESATRREKVSWLYWRFSGFREQVQVHSAEQEEAYVSLVVPEVIPFVLRHLGYNMGGLAQR